MICDICGENEAIVHVQQIMGGEIYEFHLCSDCAKKKGVTAESDGSMKFSLSQLLGGLVDSSEEESEEVSPDTACEQCGTTLQEIRDTERVGCADCYATFRSQIDDLLTEYTDEVHHKGRYPGKLHAYKAILIDKEQLKKQLEDAVKREEYEHAAHIRDRIREIEQRSQEGTSGNE
jgi:protein arginine kinase activator